MHTFAESKYTLICHITRKIHFFWMLKSNRNTFTSPSNEFGICLLRTLLQY